MACNYSRNALPSYLFNKRMFHRFYATVGSMPQPVPMHVEYEVRDEIDKMSCEK